LQVFKVRFQHCCGRCPTMGQRLFLAGSRRKHHPGRRRTVGTRKEILMVDQEAVIGA